MSLEAGFGIGDRHVFPLEGRISGPAGDLRVEPKAMAVLVELARCAPATCPRETIIGSVWPRGFVTDDVLTRCVAQLRRALGDDPKSPACLETIPKRGYRLRHPVRVREPATMLDPGIVRPRESLIVLPFQNLAPGGEDYVADGLTELLILRLAAFHELRVISRTTAMQFKASTVGVGEISQRVGADWVVEGSVLQSGDRIQVVAQLIDARTDAHLWAADYLRDLQDLLLLQNEIARRIAAAIRVHLGVTDTSAETHTPMGPGAVRSYLRGRQRMSRRTIPDLESARADLLSAAFEAPDHAAAWASVAECEMLLAHYGSPAAVTMLAEAQDHLQRALLLEPDNAICLSTRGAIRFFFRREIDAAAVDLERALAALPSYSMAMLSMANVCAVRQEFDEARTWMEQALLVDPLDVGMNMNMGDHCILQRRHADAVRALQRALELSPRHRPSQLRLSWALALDGQYDDARGLLADIAAASGVDATWQEYSALAAGAAGDHAAAVQHWHALQAIDAIQPVSAWTLARAAAAAGQHAEALAQIDAAAAARISSVPFLAVSPAFDSLHADARFHALAARLGLPRRD